MIAALKGKILLHTPRSTILMTDAGVGYELQGICGMEVIPTETDIQIYTYLQVKDDGLVLFGFGTTKLRELFQLLITVDGLGPKTAFNILQAHSFQDVVGAISQKDARFFQNISGIGNKTAARIILELSSKFGTQASAQELLEHSSDQDLIAALQALGYERKVASQMATGIANELTLEEKISQALKKIKQS